MLDTFLHIIIDDSCYAITLNISLITLRHFSLLLPPRQRRYAILIALPLTYCRYWLILHYAIDDGLRQILIITTLRQMPPALIHTPLPEPPLIRLRRYSQLIRYADSCRHDMAPFERYRPHLALTLRWLRHAILWCHYHYYAIVFSLFRPVRRVIAHVTRHSFTPRYYH